MRFLADSARAQAKAAPSLVTRDELNVGTEPTDVATLLHGRRPTGMAIAARNSELTVRKLAGYFVELSEAQSCEKIERSGDGLRVRYGDVEPKNDIRGFGGRVDLCVGHFFLISYEQNRWIEKWRRCGDSRRFVQRADVQFTPQIE